MVVAEVCCVKLQKKIKVKTESTVVAHAGSVNCGRYFRREENLWYTSGSKEDKRVNVWKYKESSARTSLSGHSSGVASLAVDGKGEWLISGCTGGSVRLWDVEAEKCVASMIGHGGAVGVSEYHPFGNFFATAGAEVKIWDARNKKAVQVYKEEIWDMKFSPHGRWLACTGNFGAKIFDLGKAEVVWERKEEISRFAFHPVDFYFATSEKNTKMWNCTNDLFGSLAFSDLEKNNSVSNVCFSGDGGFLFETGAGNFRSSKVGNDGSLTTAGMVTETPWRSGKILDVFPDGNAGDCLVLAADASDGLFAPNLSVHRVSLGVAKVERKKRDVPVEILTTASSLRGGGEDVGKSASREISRLVNQLALLRRVMTLWTKGSTLQAASEAAQDTTLFGNFLLALPLEKQNVPLSLDLCRQLLVLMPRALTETKAEIFARACGHAANVLVARFGDFIRDTRDSEISAGVDLQRELRVEKCNECFEGFKKIFTLLSRLPLADKENLDNLKAFLGN